VGSSPKALESAIERKEAHEQQLADAQRAELVAQAAASDVAEAGRVISLGPDRIQ
jgi:hypothetical protein